MNALKKLVPISIKQYIRRNVQQRLDKKDSQQFMNYLDGLKLQKKIFILDACDHRNLGDQAILMAELQFLQDHFKEYHIVSVGLGKFNDYVNIAAAYAGSEDIIVLHGGGNLGYEYKKAENTRRAIIERFPNNKIILFPQTMFFKNDEEGNRELQKSKNIYSKHKNLTLVARERTSYALMKQNFDKNKVLLTPDIVLYLNKSMTSEVRQGALFCCRNDIEGLLSEQDKESILKQLQTNFTQVSITDTIGENNFGAVDKKFNEFKKSKLVITDRLHGMVFAAITGTPCIALSNYNYKVAGTYEWIKHLNYIKFTNNIEQIPSLMAELQTMKDTKYNNQFAIAYYQQLKDSIKESKLASH